MPLHSAPEANMANSWRRIASTVCASERSTLTQRFALYLLMMLFASLLALSMIFGAHTPAFAQESACTLVCYVSPSGNDSNNGNASSPKLTIQAAVNQVTANGVVNVAAGTYAEQVTVSKNLVLVGAGATTTIIKPTNVSANTTSVGGSASFAPILLINSVAFVEISGIQVDGAAAASSGAVSSCGAGFAGIFMRDSAGLLRNVDARNLQVGVCNNSVGLLIQSADPGDTVSITRTRANASGTGVSINTPAIVSVNRSNLENNNFNAVNNSGSSAVNAECNWYGAAGGPTGGGSTVGGTVDFDPFLATNDLGAPCTVTAIASVSIVASLNVDENVAGGLAQFNVTLAPANTQFVTVPFTISDGTAVVGVDYQAPASPLVFQPGETNKTINVTLIDDVIIEPNETFNVTLGTPENATLSSGNSVGTIVDNDLNIIITPTVTIGDATIGEGDGQAVFDITLDTAGNRPITMSYTTNDVNATAGADYTTASGQVTIAPGDTGATIIVPILEDATVETSETFQVVLSSLQNVDPGEPSLAGIGTILDNEITPTVSINNITVNESASEAIFTVSLNKASSRAATFDYSTNDGTANAVFDYAPTSGKLTIPAGSLTAQLKVALNNDSDGESDETFTLRLNNPVNATIPVNKGIGTATILDDEVIPVVSLSPGKITVNEGVAKAELLVTLSSRASGVVTVTYATSNGSAAAGSDYTAANAQVVFAAGTSVKTISIPILEDTAQEGDETFSVALSAPQGATIGNMKSDVTIQDNDVNGGKVTIKLNLVGNTLTDGPNHSFDGSYGAFILDNGPEHPTEQTFNSPTGIRTVRYITNTSDYTLTGISCAPSQPTNLATGTVTVTINSGTEVVCTYTSERSVNIRAQIYNDVNGNHSRDKDEPGLNGWQAVLTNNATGAVISKKSATFGNVSFTRLPPGNYKVCETLQAGFVNTQPTGDVCYTFTLVAGQSGYPIFGNKLGSGDGTSSPGTVIFASESEVGSELEGYPPTPDRWDEADHNFANLQNFYLPLVFQK